MNSYLSSKNKFYGRECLVIACGPSAKYWKDVLEINKNQVIVTVKQAIDIVPEGIPQIHFYNSHNCKNYYINRYNHKETFKIFQDDLDGPRQFNEYDLRFCVCKSKIKPWNDCLALNKDIDKYSLEKSGIKRPWGPGIIFESVLYFLEFAGFKKINLVGFDNGRSTQYGHFYDKPLNRNKTYTRETSKFDPTTINLYRHLAGLEYSSGMKPMQITGFNESEKINDLLPLFNQWLDSRDIDFTIYTDFSGQISNCKFAKQIQSVIN